MNLMMRKRLLYKLIPNRPSLSFDLFFSLHLYNYKFDAYKYLIKHSKVMHIDSPLARPRHYRVAIRHVPVSLVETISQTKQGDQLSFSMHVQGCYRDAIKQIQWFYLLRDTVVKSNLVVAPADTKVYIKYHYIKIQDDGYIDKVREQVGIEDMNKMVKAFTTTIWRNCIVINH